MVVYERVMSFSLLRGLLVSSMPAFIAYILFTVYYALVDGYGSTDASDLALSQLRYWYRTYPQYLALGHFIIFLANVVYRRRLVNWWAQIVTIVGVILLLRVDHLGLDTAFSQVPQFQPRSITDPRAQSSTPASGLAMSTGSRPNLLGDYASRNAHTAAHTLTLRPNSRGAYHVRAIVGSMPVAFQLAPDSQFTTIAYDRLKDFAALGCTETHFETSRGPVDACSMLIPDMDIGPVHLRQVQAVFLPTIRSTSFMGADLLGRIGYSPQTDSVVLGLRQP